MKQQSSIGIIAAVPFVMAWFLAYGSFQGKTAENILEGPNSARPMAAEFTNDLGMKFVLIPAGTFLMSSPLDEIGRDSDERRHQVTLTRPFYM